MNITCDVNSANMYFLKTQNKIVTSYGSSFVFNFYMGKTANRNGWLFPSEINTIEALRPYISDLLTIDANPSFVLLSLEQKELLEACLKNYFPASKIDFLYDEGDRDYIYSVQKMAELKGKDFQKKRNHISRFMRTFQDNWSFNFCIGKLESEQAADFQKIYNNWKSSDFQNEDEFLLSEEKSLKTALQDFENLKMTGAVLYVNKEPVAFLLGSFTTNQCLNIHFEKCIDEYVNHGALAVLNQQFAKQVSSTFPECIYLNREEDLNIPGLRKSKKSYQPDMLLEKYYGTLRGNYGEKDCINDSGSN